MNRIKKASLALVLAISLLLPIGITPYAENENVGNESMRFNDDGKFTIMQVADPQDNQNPRKAMLDMLDVAYDRVEPDLVVFTGDNILGRIGENNSYSKKYEMLEEALDAVIKPLEDRGIPFVVTFGNHDDQCGVSKEEQIKIYRRYTNCRGFNDTDPSIGRSTFNMPIMSSDGQEISYNLWLMESAGNDESGQYFEHISTAALNWYKNKSDELCAQNDGEPVMSLMFQHIPVPEIYELLTEVSKGTKGAVEKNDKYYVLNEEMATGYLGESPCVTRENFGQLDVIAAQGDVKAIAFGHDHINSFIGNLRGVDIVQTQGASFRSYGNHLRGVRVFTVDENDTQNYETYTLDFYDLIGNDAKAKLQFIFNADEKIALRIAVCLFPVIILFWTHF
jgi:hypothetical protein